MQNADSTSYKQLSNVEPSNMTSSTSNEHDDFYIEQWRNLITACCKPDSLDEDDVRYIAVNTTWNDVQRQISKPDGSAINSTYNPEFTILSRNLKQLKIFVDAIANDIASGLNPAVFWGFNGLVIKLAQEEEGAITRVPRMLRQVCRKIEILNSYCITKSKIIPQMKESCFEIALSLLAFYSDVVKFIRRLRHNSFEGRDDWRPLEQQADSVLRDLDDAVSSIEKISRSSERLPDLSQLKVLLTGLSPQVEITEQAKLPCYIFPTFRVAKFFDRSNVLMEIDRTLERQKSERSFQSLALWGLGGVGKSSVALRYVETRIRDEQLDAMFWILSEKEVTIRQSFTDIAVQLKLPGANAADHGENRTLVLNWLNHTKCRWLLVYDNAEDADLLMSHWPAATRGQALITTRKSAFGFDPASGALEITTWDAKMSSMFLLHLLSTDITEQLTSEDTSGADELTKKLNGHALAISQFAGLIQRRSWSISEFVKLYNQQPDKIHGIFGNKSINTIWNISFKSLDAQSRTMLGIVCFLEPDHIPEALFDFKPRENEELSERLKFTQDKLVFSAVIEELLTSALIKRDKDRRALTVHRLVQEAFKYFMSAKERQQSFDDATIFLWTSFPGLDPEAQQLYPVWSTCALYLPHALSMLDAFKQEVKTNPEFKVLIQYCRLNNNVARYCFETNALEDMMEVTSVNLKALATKPSMSHHERIFAEGGLDSYRGQLFSIIGRPAEGCEYLEKSYDLMCEDDPYNPQEECLAASNYSHGLGSMNKFDEAVQWSEKALKHWFEYRPEDRESGLCAPAVKLTLGLPLLFNGKAGRAREALLEGKTQIESSRVYLWQMAARFDLALGTLERREQNFEHAEALCMDAQNKWLMNRNMRTDPFNGSIMYKVGCISLDQGKTEAAVKHFHDALQVTSLHKATLKAEHARCMFKLSEALQQEPGHENEAQFFRDEAERLLYQTEPNASNPGLEKSYDDLINLYWR